MISDRINEIKPFLVMDILARAKALERQGWDVIHLEIGEPDFPTPQPVIEAAREFIATGQVKYTPASGDPELRVAIADYYRERYSVAVPPACIFVTPGASGAFLLALGLLLDQGDEVLIADPGYPCYANLVRLFGGLPHCIPVGMDSRFHLDARRIQEHYGVRTKGAISASPSNPTGTSMPESVLADVVRTLEESGGFLISDEIYHGLEYGYNSPTARQFSENVFIINSFSKYFGMTGWRLGWLVVPERHIAAAEKVAQNIFISAPAPTQRAAVAALSNACRGELEQRRREFQRRRDFLLRVVNELGFSVPLRPDGAFYLYADCSAFTGDSAVFARELLETAAVAITPGVDFGAFEASKHVRFAFTVPLARLEEAATRLAGFLGRCGH